MAESRIPGLYASAPAALPFAPSLDVRAFLLQREAGNLLLYNAPTVESDAETLEGLGGVSRQYLNHWHEASFGCDQVARAFGAPLVCHAADASSVEESCQVGETFSERTTLDSDLEVIPTPGHTAGATAYLWDSGEHRCLFTGDTIYFDEGRWIAAVLESSDRDAYLESLELIRGLDFDVLVPWVATGGQPYLESTDVETSRRRIDAIIERLRRGEDR